MKSLNAGCMEDTMAFKFASPGQVQAWSGNPEPDGESLLGIDSFFKKPSPPKWKSSLAHMPQADLIPLTPVSRNRNLQFLK